MTKTTKTMTTKQALTKAREYIAERKAIRTLLIAEARRTVDKALPKLKSFERGNKEHNTLRKLYHWPADLSDERILAIIDKYKETK
jgi:hypothetical protein